MKAYEPTFDEDGVPWASEEIQKDYEAALGAFLVAFNRLDNLLTRVIELLLIALKRHDLVPLCTTGTFAQKVLTLDLLKHSTEGAVISSVPIETIREIGKHRNIVAHGHFDQNPHSGAYEIVGKKSHQYRTELLESQASEATRVWLILRNSEAHYKLPPLFDDEASSSSFTLAS